jgi:AraC-like DNA-binding protein
MPTRIGQRYDRTIRIADVADVADVSEATLNRHFRAATAAPDDIAGVGHEVGYDSPSQFSREYRRRFGIPPGQDAIRLQGKVLAEESV